MRDATPHDSEQQASNPEVLPAPNARPSRSDQVVSRQVGNETILVPVRSTKSALDDIFTLNEVASRTWEMIDGRKTIAEIASVIESEYDVSSEAALADTLELIARFREAEAITLPET